MSVSQFHPQFWCPLIFEVLEHSRCQSVSTNNSAIILWNPVVVLDSANYCTLYHLVNSKAQKLNNQVRITFTIFGRRLRLASFTCDFLWQDLHVLTACFICGPKWSSSLYVNIDHYFFGTMSKRKISSYSQHETDKSSTKQKKKLKTNFMRRKMTLNFQIRKLTISRQKIELNLHLPAYAHFLYD